MIFSKAQTSAYRIFGKELSVTAGAGSGKTSVLVERFLYAVTEKGVSPTRILAITFTEKAANEMKSRLVEECRKRGLYDFRREIENAYISTIHSFCARLLKENPIESALDPDFRVMGEGESDILTARVLDALFESEMGNGGWMRILSQIGEDQAREAIRNFYELYRATGGDESIFNIKSSSEHEEERKKEWVRVVRQFKDLIENEKRALSSYDFDDLLFLSYKLLSESSPIQEAIRKRYQKKFELVMVDEYQDVSPLQDKLIDLLKSEANLFVVGDIQQSIYGFRHAEPEVFKRRMKTHLTEKKAQNLVLSENYRSHPEILQFVNQFFSSLFPSAEFFPLEAKKVFKAAKAPTVELLCLPRDKKEDDADADGMRVREGVSIASWINELVESGFEIEDAGKRRAVCYGDIAILLRAAAPARFYEKELSQRNIPYHTVKGKGFYDKPEIADLVGFLTLIENPEDDIALAGVLRSPLVGIQDDTLYYLAKYAKKASNKTPLFKGLDWTKDLLEISGKDGKKLLRFKDLLNRLRVEKDTRRLSGVLEGLVFETDYEAKLLTHKEGKQRVANVRKLLQMAREFETSAIVGIEDFVRFLGKLSERDRLEPEAKLESKSRDAVTISTIHAVKGLEYPVVIVADMGSKKRAGNHGPFLAMAGVGLGQRIKDLMSGEKTDDETYQKIVEILSAREAAEEWRLLYVAMTRAKEKLLLSGTLILSAKDGEYKKEGSWMNTVCSELGYHPARPPKKIVYHGIEIGLVSLGSTEKRFKNPVSTAHAIEWPKDFSTVLRSRLNSPFRSYEEAQDRTVSDLLEAWSGGQKKTWLQEEADRGKESEVLLGERTPANEFGTLFHRYMEYLIKKKILRVRESAWESPFFANLSKDEKEKMKEHVLGFWHGPLGRQVRTAKKRYPELPFVIKTKKGLLKGQIDLVFQTSKGEWVILDYKTNQLSPSEKPDLAAFYEPQILLYSFVFGKLFGEFPKKGVLYFSSIGETFEYSYDALSFQGVEERLDF